MYADDTYSGSAMSSSQGLHTTRSTVSSIYDTPDAGHDHSNHVNHSFTRRALTPVATQPVSSTEEYKEMVHCKTNTLSVCSA